MSAGSTPGYGCARLDCSFTSAAGQRHRPVVAPLSRPGDQGWRVVSRLAESARFVVLHLDNTSGPPELRNRSVRWIDKHIFNQRAYAGPVTGMERTAPVSRSWSAPTSAPPRPADSSS